MSPSAPDVSPRHGLAALWAALALWTLLLAAATGTLLHERQVQQRGQAVAAARVGVQALGNTLELGLQQLAALPEHLARQPQLRDFIGRPSRSPQEVEAMEQELATTMRSFAITALLVTDARGTVLAGGTTERSLLGEDFSEREYLRAALTRGAAARYTVSRSSARPALVFAQRIEHEGRVLGAVVAQQDADRFDRLLPDTRTEARLFVVDANGVVLLAGQQADRLRRLPLAPQTASSEPAMRELYRELPAPLDWQLQRVRIQGQLMPAATIGGRLHAALSLPLERWPLTVWALAPLEPGTQTGLVTTALGLWGLGALLIWTGWRQLRLRDAAQRARRDFGELAQALPLTVFRWLQPAQGSGRFLLLGPGAESLLELEEGTLQRDPARAWRLIDPAAGVPPLQPVEFRLRGNGSARWLRVQATPQPAAAGATVFNGYWLDVSAAREAQARFEAVFAQAAHGGVLFDRQRGITQCNAAALRLFGADAPERLLGRSLWADGLSPPQQGDGSWSRERAATVMEEQLRSGQRLRLQEWRFRRLNGQAFDAEVSLIVLDGSGEPQWCALIEDVTLRRQAHAALLQAREAAEAASQTKSSFLANMSHELRTPMNAIIGMTHLALDDGLPPRQREYIRKAHSAARSLLDILNDILDVSKIEAGRLELEHIPFELDSVVGEMADVLGIRADEKGLELLFSAAPDLPQHLVGDPTRLRQVLVNLGSNAIKFTDHGEVTLGMELLSQDAHSVELHVWVRDTGVGMSDEQLTRIFTPFVQADSSTTRRFGGTGLGLAISRQLVEKMGGRLWADSAPGRGSTFHFSARFGRGDTAAQRAFSAAELHGQRVLLADDNAAAREVLGEMLGRMGLQVEAVGDGEQALQRLHHAPEAYHWILLDWKMPRLDGVECARRIVAEQPRLAGRILLVTAFGRDEAAGAGAALGLAGVLAKPVTASHLFDALTRTIRPLPARPPMQPATDEQARRQLHGARVLLVEDHPINRELACELLQRAGIQVQVAEDGEQALRRLAQDGPFDGVLMDCQMPVMDGYSATRALRADPRWRDLPVIAMTASALAEDRTRALASGMNAHISKPIDLETMLTTMAQWIHPRTAAARSPESSSPPPALGSGSAEGPGTDWLPGAGGAIDTDSGLARCMGRADLYRRLLRGFRHTQEDFSEAVTQALAEERPRDARRRAHDLKGLAGSIGAAGLEHAAQALQQALDGGDATATEAARLRCDDELAQVLSEIDHMLPQRGDTAFGAL